MKELILLAGLTLLASKSISQNVTKTNNVTHKDSVVILPVDIARKVMFDLEDGDECFESVEVLRSDIKEKDKIIVFKDTTISRQKRVIYSCEKNLIDLQEVDSLNQATIRNLNIKLHKEINHKKAWKYVAGFFALVAAFVR